MPPKPTPDIDMAEFQTMQNLMIRVQDEARGIRNLQDNVLPKLRTQLSETTGIFKGKERKALTEQIQQTENNECHALRDILMLRKTAAMVLPIHGGIHSLVSVPAFE